MSLYRFLASNKPLPEVQNEKIKFLSIPEALARGIKIPDSLLNPDAHKKGIGKSIMCFEKEEDLYEIEIHPLDPNEFTGQYTQLPYLAELTGKVTQSTVNRLAQYVIELSIPSRSSNVAYSSSMHSTHLNVPVTVLELWQVWEGEYSKWKEIHVDHETQVVSVLQEHLFEQNYKGAICLKFNMTEGE